MVDTHGERRPSGCGSMPVGAIPLQQKLSVMFGYDGDGDLEFVRCVVCSDESRRRAVRGNVSGHRAGLKGFRARGVCGLARVVEHFACTCYFECRTLLETIH